MSNRFVSGGIIGSGGESVKEDATTSQASAEAPTPAKNAEWEAVQRELEADRQRREEQRRKAACGEEKSLYDILQENKAAKQAAFEEQTKVRNQFRALDDDEVGFLDEVREQKRREEEQVKRETEEGLKAFREARKESGEGPVQAEQESEVESWGVGRKRKRAKEREIKGLRRRVSEGEATKDNGENANKASKDEKKAKKEAEEPQQESTLTKPTKSGISLVDYGSDDSD